MDERMTVVNDEVLDGGGGTRIRELIVNNGLELKSIGITHECIVGYNCRFDEAERDNQLWVAGSFEELKDGCPPELLTEVCTRYFEFIENDPSENYLHIPFSYSKSESDKSLYLLKEFARIATQLSLNWHHETLDSVKYPFDKSFDEIALEINLWDFKVNTDHRKK